MRSPAAALLAVALGLAVPLASLEAPQATNGFLFYENAADTVAVVPEYLPATAAATPPTTAR